MIIVGIGGYAVSENDKESIITHALGSCVAFIVRCPKTRKTAMAHIVLPETDRVEQYKYLRNKPGYFADLIIPKIISDFSRNQSCKVEHLQVTIAGGADARNPNDVFRVGPRNVEKVRHFLRLHGIHPKFIDVGGDISRTVEIFVSNGHVDIRRQKMIV